MNILVYKDGLYYYNNQPCEKVDKIEIGIVVNHYGDRAGTFDIHDTGYIFGRTLCGKIQLRITPINNICPTCNKLFTPKETFCTNLYHKSFNI